MATRGGSTTFERHHVLTGVRETDQELGHGSYATVVQLEYMGLKCAGKKIHDILLRQGRGSYAIRRFMEECGLLSQVRHPNIVQFLGVYFRQGVQVPILVMEFLPTNLTSCIEQYGNDIGSKEVGYSILHDVALGLYYLHSQTPPIIHRDLSSNNILLTPNMTAKISDLGVARILNMSPLQMSRMTETPGTPSYMPPEVMVADPVYDTSIDVFSYGIMMIHIFSGRWPEPQIGQTRIEAGKLVPVTEAERRLVFLQAIGWNHCFMNLILRCIHNDPQMRPHLREIVQHVSIVKERFPVGFSNQLEMLICIKNDEQEKRNLTSELERREVLVRYKEEQLCALVEAQKDEQQKAAQEKQRVAERIEQLESVLLCEVSEKELYIKDLEAEITLLKQENQEKMRELDTAVGQLELEIKSSHEMKSQIQATLDKERMNFAIKKIQLETEIAHLNHSIDDINVRMKNEIAVKDATIERLKLENTTKSQVVKSKAATISGMREQFIQVKERLIIDQPLPAVSIIWKQCADLPVEIIEGSSTALNGKVYCQGAISNPESEYIVYCCDLTQNTMAWSSLPQLPVRDFCLSQVNNELVAVGGARKLSNGMLISNIIFTLDQTSQKWIQKIPPMPTRRYSCAALSLPSALIVAGGYIDQSSQTDVIEVFRSELSTWYRIEPLQLKCSSMAIIAIDDVCYVLGGLKSTSSLNQVFYASIDDLLCSAVPANEISSSASLSSCTVTQTVWKSLPNTPTYLCGQVAATLADNLVIVGGEVMSDGEQNSNMVYMYSPSTSEWVHISDLPTPRSMATVVTLSSGEILMMGGLGDDNLCAVYSGKLTIQI